MKLAWLASRVSMVARKVVEEDLKKLKRIFEKDEEFIHRLRDGDDKQLLRTAIT